MLTGPRQRFAELARLPDGELDLAECALVIAAEAYPSLAIDRYRARLDELAELARARLAEIHSQTGRVERLNHFLFVEEGFAGNREHYDDPRNSYLNEVLDRRRGIPITLSLVYSEVARRVGVPARGVGFPGHFLVVVEGGDRPIVDPFHGRVIDESECQRRLAALLGPRVVLDPEQHLRPAAPREILVRMLVNLKHIHLRVRDYARALGCCERILLLVPELPSELRDRGLVFEKLECFGAARADLERFLELAPEDESADAVRERLVALRGRAPRLH